MPDIWSSLHMLCFSLRVVPTQPPKCFALSYSVTRRPPFLSTHHDRRPRWLEWWKLDIYNTPLNNIPLMQNFPASRSTSNVPWSCLASRDLFLWLLVLDLVSLIIARKTRCFGILIQVKFCPSEKPTAQILIWAIQYDSYRRISPRNSDICLARIFCNAFKKR